MRCGCTEYLLAQMAQSQWPRSCMSLRYYATTGGLMGMTEAEFDEQIKRSLRNCTEASGLDIVRTFNRGEANIEMRPEAMRGSILAYAYLPNNSCGEMLAVRFNSTVRWTPQLFIDTHTHELGHAFGLSHTNDVRDIMYPSMGRDYAGKYSDYYSIPQLRSRYGPEVDDDDDDGGNDDTPGGDDMGNIPWLEIFGMIFKLIQFCGDQPDETILQQLRNPRPFQRIRFEWKVRRTMGIRPREWREKRSAIMAEIWNEHQIATDGDLLALIREARESVFIDSDVA